MTRWSRLPGACCSEGIRVRGDGLAGAETSSVLELHADGGAVFDHNVADVGFSHYRAAGSLQRLRNAFGELTRATHAQAPWPLVESRNENGQPHAGAAQVKGIASLHGEQQNPGLHFLALEELVADALGGHVHHLENAQTVFSAFERRGHL